MGDILRVEALLVKKETSYGVDPTPGVTDAVRITERLFPLLKAADLFENDRADVVSGGLISVKPGIVKGGYVDIDIPWELKGKGSAYALSTDIEADPLIQACGFSVAVVTTPSSEKLTYTFVDTGHASCFMYAYAGGLLWKLSGARGNFVWDIEAGKNAKMIFKMRAMLASDPTTVSVPTPTYDASQSPAAVGCGFTLDPGTPYTPTWNKASFDAGNGVELVEDGNATDGIAAAEITERGNPQFMCTIRKDPLATYNPFALLKAVTSHTIALTQGGTQYNRVKLASSEAYLAKKPEPIDYFKSAGWNLSFAVKQANIVFD